jgi:hypothetical protein
VQVWRFGGKVILFGSPLASHMVSKGRFFGASRVRAPRCSTGKQSQGEVYRLTKTGRRQLATETSRWERLVEGVAKVLRPAAAEPDGVARFFAADAGMRSVNGISSLT